MSELSLDALTQARDAVEEAQAALREAIEKLASVMPVTPERKLQGRRVVITLSLPPDLIERFDAEAVRRGRSRAALLAIVMREWLEREPPST